MFKRLGKIFLVLALVATLGAHWALLQTVAWTTMLAENLCSHIHSPRKPWTETFDGNHPCEMCKAIAAEKQSEKENRIQFADAKTGIPASRTKFCFDCAVAISTFAAGKFLLKIFFTKTTFAAAVACGILRLIQSQFGCPRPVGAGEICFF